jgi:hypothetical protein
LMTSPAASMSAHSCLRTANLESGFRVDQWAGLFEWGSACHASAFVSIFAFVCAHLCVCVCCVCVHNCVCVCVCVCVRARVM